MSNRKPASAGEVIAEVEGACAEVQFSIVPMGPASGNVTVQIECEGTEVFEDLLDDTGAPWVLDMSTVNVGSARTRTFVGDAVLVRAKSSNTADQFDLVVSVLRARGHPYD